MEVYDPRVVPTDENVLMEIYSQPDPMIPVTILLYMNVENNTIKELRRMWWTDDNAIADYMSNLINKGFMYDDAHYAFSRRNKPGRLSSRETYQFIDSNAYNYVKTRLGL